MIPFQIPAYPKPLSISQARSTLPPEEFRTRLRDHLKSNPGLTLAQVARQLNISRQAVHQITGKLNRPNAASPLFFRTAPKTEQAKLKLPELNSMVARGDSAEQAAAKLGISINRAYALGFRSRTIRKPHGSRSGCNCARRRKAHGLAIPRTRIDATMQAQILDWCAWSDPLTGEGLAQGEIARLAGVSQMTVSRIAGGAGHWESNSAIAATAPTSKSS
jgi:DNA-binding CsgD family transcriptional regulator